MATARAIERWSFAAAALVVFANAEYRARAERDGLLRGDCEVVPNGWSLPDVPPDPRWRDGADHLLAYVGTIGEQDNVDRLVDAVAELGVPGRVRVVVAGDGSALEAVRSARASAASPAPSSGSGSCGPRPHRVARPRGGRVRRAGDRLGLQPPRHVREGRRVHVGRRAGGRAPPAADRALAGDTLEYAPDMTAAGLAAAIGALLEDPGRARGLGDGGARALRRADQLGARRRPAAGRRATSAARVARVPEPAAAAAGRPGRRRWPCRRGSRGRWSGSTRGRRM